jgi:hypothetical protein
MCVEMVQKYGRMDHEDIKDRLDAINYDAKQQVQTYYYIGLRNCLFMGRFRCMG